MIPNVALIDEALAKAKALGCVRIPGGDPAVIGLSEESVTLEPALVYNREDLVRCLMDEGRTEDEAIAFYTQYLERFSHGPCPVIISLCE